MKSSGANSTPLLLTALMVAVLGALFYFVVLPKSGEVSSMEASVAQSEQAVAALQQQIELQSSTQKTEVVNEFAVRKKLPAKRDIEELLRNIEEMEYVTGTRITSVSFNNYDALVSGSTLVDPNAPVQADPATDPNAQTAPAEGQAPADGQTPAASTTSETTTTENEEAPAEEMPVSFMDVLTLPPNLKMITFNLEVEAPNELSLVLFLKEIEKLERVMNVETINFSLLGEENGYTPDTSEVVSVSVQVTTFYYE